jgi:hypothetical protein
MEKNAKVRLTIGHGIFLRNDTQSIYFLLNCAISNLQRDVFPTVDSERRDKVSDTSSIQTDCKRFNQAKLSGKHEIRFHTKSAAKRHPRERFGELNTTPAT